MDFILGEGTVLVLTSSSVRAFCLSLKFERTQLLSFMIRSAKSTFMCVSVLNSSVGLRTFLLIKFILWQLYTCACSHSCPPSSPFYTCHLSPLPTSMPFSFALCSTDFNQGHLCGHMFTTIHQHIYGWRKWLFFSQTPSVANSSARRHRDHGPLSGPWLAIDVPSFVQAKYMQLQLLWDHICNGYVIP